MSTDFLFTLQLADEALFDDMLGEVATTVLGRLGCREDLSSEMVDLLHGALAEGVKDGLHQCEVQFRMRGDAVQIVVTFVGGRMWLKTCPIS